MTDLLPCPFCGAHPYYDEGTAMVFGTRTKHNYAIACSSCEISASGSHSFNQAITAWNTRTPPHITDAMVDAALKSWPLSSHLTRKAMRAALAAALGVM